ncbi:MarR family transcriptional regulator [Mycobacterium intracellulare]|uniref:MarR family transcriptional regulator n=1 Tax=Mycobacterium intracellulare TaxID=1767 RepID=UPI001EED80F1|nr:MarR family transcriptional regulator [Mycobacterium intracellulare]MEE3753154.1 MarR family transcriptional regulator [Mycobacterium intracellulare]
MTELAVLQGVRLKGRIATDDLAATLGQEPASVAGVVDALGESGLLVAGKFLRITPEGRARLGELLAEERAAVNQTSVTAAYNEFRDVNTDFKALVSDWQLKGGAPNPHDDPDYDAGVLRRLDHVHERTLPIIASVATQLPRLADYADKLRTALEKVRSGDTAWLTRPIVDSYHTVWFELHEELIEAAGLTREDEAAAGHA